MLFVLNLWNLVCTSYLQHLSPWTSLLSSPQQPHTANGYWTGQHSSGRQVWPAHPCAPLPVHAALLPLYTQSFKNPFSPCRAQREPCSYWKVLSDHFRSLCSHQILHNYFSQLSGRTLEYLSSYCLQQLFPLPFFLLLFTVSYLWSSSQVGRQDPQRDENILNSLLLLVQYLPHGIQIFGGWYKKCSV